MNFGLRLARSNMCSVALPSIDYQIEKLDKLQCPFALLSGEEISFSGKTLEGTITITNYRVTLQHEEIIFHVPLGVIDQTEVRKISSLHILCKDARSYKCTFSTGDLCLEWQRKIEDVISVPTDIKEVFAYKNYMALSVDNPDLHNLLTSQTSGSSYIAVSSKIFEDEIKRLKFDMGGAWRISKYNEDYRLCPSYPRKIIVPSSISDSNLEGVARFRSSRRIPAVVWRHPNGAVIARSSQPEVGWLGWRSNEDEDLIKALSEACAYDSPQLPQNKDESKLQQSKSASGILDKSDLWVDSADDKKDLSMSSDVPSLCDLPEAKSQTDIKKLLIIDARSYATAVANRARGGGCECPEYYPTCEIQFMNLDNIHGIRKSHQALRHLVSLPTDIPNWLSLLENSRWLTHMSGLLKAAVIVVQTIAMEGRPVLVHCSDGWDRTPQITSLAEVLLDSYYRTLEGFQVLVEREWIEFGHKFGDRCGCGIGSEDCNERSPIFLQWLDCIYQLLVQFPTSFQFNQSFLIKLAQHVYSNMFGTFLFNSSQKRIQAEDGGNFHSVWSLFRINQLQYMNLLYNPMNQALYPSCHTKDLELWKAVYITKVEKNTDESCSIVTDDIYYKEEEVLKPDRDLVKTKSCDDLTMLTSNPSPQMGRRSSDPNLRDSAPDLVMLKSALGSEVVDDDSCHRKADISYDMKLNSKEIYDEQIQKSEVTNLPTCVSGNGFINEFDLDVKDLKSMKPSNKTVGTKSPDVTEDFILHHSNLEICKKCIEGSTDTLVSESGIMAAESHSSCEKAHFEAVNGISATNFKKKSSPRDKAERESMSAITQSARNSSKKLGPSFLCDSVFPPEERSQDDCCIHLSKTISTIAECNNCYQSRKFLNDIRAMGAQLLDLASNGTGGQKQSSKGTRYSTPGHSRSPSSGIASTPNNERYFLGAHEKVQTIHSVDGLASYSDDITRRLEQIYLQHQSDIENLKRELCRVKMINQQLQMKLNHHNQENHLEDQVSLPESVGSGSGGSVGQESGMSDASWEALDEGEYKATLWLPDHAVDRCMGCNSLFWIGRRKHHCRSCGKIFCAECSSHNVPIPKENLYEPVRVCSTCFTAITDFRPKSVTVASD